MAAIFVLLGALKLVAEFVEWIWEGVRVSGWGGDHSGVLTYAGERILGWKVSRGYFSMTLVWRVICGTVASHGGSIGP